MGSYLTGARILETHLYKPQTYPFDLIAPITIIWKPICQSPDPNPPSDSASADAAIQNPTDLSETVNSRKNSGKGKGKGKATDPCVLEKATSSAPDSNISRTVWIRSHPSIYNEVFSALQSSASLTLDIVKHSSNGDESQSVEIELASLRGQINVFEIMGPKSNQVIKGALTPVAEDKREEFKKVQNVGMRPPFSQR